MKTILLISQWGDSVNYLNGQLEVCGYDDEWRITYFSGNQVSGNFAGLAGGGGLETNGIILYKIKKTVMIYDEKPKGFWASLFNAMEIPVPFKLVKKIAMEIHKRASRAGEGLTQIFIEDISKEIEKEFIGKASKE